ncbi:MAG TPA: HDOD domain-containing protein [Steroidobacteraceae bacterium]|jgi:EAL and modified HD-GYP domain-containing signal transduction protein|nr:HDOD domain-containing protein [Steroidobacteraceae bacterium]
MAKNMIQNINAVAAATPEGGSVALVARQPIYGKAMTVVAYELLYADSGSDPGAPSKGAKEDALRMLADAALDIGLDRLAGSLPVYIAYPRELLVTEAPASLHPDQVIIEIPGNLVADEKVLHGVRALRKRGHHIALDDYSPQLTSAGLLDLIDIIKLPLPQFTPAELAHMAPELIRRGLKLIAKKVATIEQFEHASQLGFDGFQGDFLQRPEQFHSQRAPRNGFATLRLVATLQNPECTVREVEQLISQDLSMSYRILRCINSSYYGLPQEIDSIRQALLLLGMDNLRQLCSLAALQQLENRPPSLFVTAMARAHMCEQLARLAGKNPTGPYFITGLFSMLDVLMGMPMAKIVDELPLAPLVESALVAGEGDAGAALACARAYESATWLHARYRDIAPHLIRAAYLDAVYGAEQALLQMQTPGTGATAPPVRPGRR